MPKKVDLPFGAQFSPGQVRLPEVLEVLFRNDGNPGASKSEFHDLYFSNQTWKHGENVYLGAKAYGLVDEDGHPTHLGARLFDMREKPDEIYSEFARHMLTSLHGLELIEIVKTIKAQGKSPTLEAIARAFKQRGLHVSQSGMHVSSMRGWLAKAGLVTAEGEFEVMPDQADRLRALLGINEEDARALRGLNRLQRAYIRAMVNLGVTGEYDAIKIRDHASALYKVEFPEKSIRQVLDPLKEAGLIDFEPPGRTGRTFIRPTPKFRAELVEPLLEAAANRPKMPSRRFVAMPFTDLLAFARRKDADVTSDPRTIKAERGEALEALAIRLAWLLGLDIMGWRKRSAETGGNEVDLLAESTTPTFARWQIQCKVADHITNDVVMREAGVAGLLHSNVILIVTTGEPGGPAKEAARWIMTKQSVNVHFLSGTNLDRIAQDESRIVEILEQQSDEIRALKKLSEEALESAKQEA